MQVLPFQVHFRQSEGVWKETIYKQKVLVQESYLGNNARTTSFGRMLSIFDPNRGNGTDSEVWMQHAFGACAS